jgi:hypothetical protein
MNRKDYKYLRSKKNNFFRNLKISVSLKARGLGGIFQSGALLRTASNRTFYQSSITSPLAVRNSPPDGNSSGLKRKLKVFYYFN